MKTILHFTKTLLHVDAQHTFQTPSCFIPFMGKPFIQHLVEYLERHDLHELHVFISDNADRIESFLGDGIRWGIEIHYHLVKNPRDFSKRIAQAAFLEKDELVLMGDGLTLPAFKREDLERPVTFTDSFSGTEENSSDTGWHVTSKKILEKAAAEQEKEYSAIRHPTLSVRSFKDIHLSQKKVLEGAFPEIIHFGKLYREGIWIGQGSVLPKSITLIPPVYIGPNTRIEDQTYIGPYAEIGKGCFIDGNSYIKDSIIFPGSYVGKDLDIHDCIIKENQIVNTNIGAMYTSFDNSLVSSMEAGRISSETVSASLFSRVTALILWIISLPIMFAAAIFSIFRKGPLFRKETFIQVPSTDQNADQNADHHTEHNTGASGIPASAASAYAETFCIRTFCNRETYPHSSWRHLILYVIPGLGAVIRGKCRIVGLNPKTPEEAAALSVTWREVYHKSYAGLISERDVLYRNIPAEELSFAAEMYYAVHDSFRYNLKIVLRFIRNLFYHKNQLY